MGTSKELLTLDNQTFVERVVHVLRTSCQPIILSTRRDQQLPDGLGTVIVAEDQAPDAGSLHGLHRGLVTALPFGEHAIVCACDYPLVEAGLFAVLLSLVGSHQAAIPEAHGKSHPLLACYRTDVYRIAGEQLSAGDRRVMNCVAKLDVRMVLEAEVIQACGSLESLRNVNTPEDLANLGIRGINPPRR